MATTDYDLGMSTGTTYVSVPGNAPNQQSNQGAPGSSGPASDMAVHHAAMLLIGTSFAALLVIGFVFRRGTVS